jgi:hypothetical protein
MVHARRKFYALVDSDPRVAYPLELIGKLYRVEDFADRRGLSPEERQQLRQERSTGILERLQRWITKTAAREPPESALHKACAYSINHWEALTRFLQDGLLALDNNLCELQIRSLAIGRRNWLFCWTEVGARYVGIIHSLLATCRLQGVDPYTYLVDVFQRVETHPARDVHLLTPRLWKQHFAHQPMRSDLDRFRQGSFG